MSHHRHAHPPLVPLTASELDDPSFGQNCIGCSPRNAKGLHLHFTPHGHEVRAELTLDRSYESYPGMIHGGVVAVILDEVTGRAALWRARCFVMTMGIRLRYASIMVPGRRYIARAEATATADDQLRADGVLEDDTGRLVATAAATFTALRGAQLAAALADLPEPTRALARELDALGHAHS